MEVSLYHRLVGAWSAAAAAGRDFSVLSPPWAVARSLWLGVMDGTLGLLEDLPECPLMGAFSLLPILLFYHGDPLDLGDRLGQLGGDHPLILELGHGVGACLRERLTLHDWFAWCDRHAQSHGGENRALIQALTPGSMTWRQWREWLQTLSIDPAERQLLIIYGALIWGRGQTLHCESLVMAESPIVQAWVRILLGCIRGDRQSPVSFSLSPNERDNIHQEVRQWWSHWSGLPVGSELQLTQLPIIASCQVLQTRPTLSLISQRHLP